MALKSLKTDTLNTVGDVNGLVHINTTSFSAVASVSLPNETFSATYDNYLIKFNDATASDSGFTDFRMRASSSDDTTSNYRIQRIDSFATTINTARQTGITNWAPGIWINDTFQNENQLLLCNPFKTNITSGFVQTCLNSNGDIEYIQTALGLNTLTSYDSLSAIRRSGTFSGSISVYGYQK